MIVFCGQTEYSGWWTPILWPNHAGSCVLDRLLGWLVVAFFRFWPWVLKADMYRQLGNDTVSTLGDWCHSWRCWCGRIPVRCRFWFLGSCWYIQIWENNEESATIRNNPANVGYKLVFNLHSSQHDPNLPQYIGINVKDHTNQTPADSRYVVAQNKTQKEEGRLPVKF